MLELQKEVNRERHLLFRVGDYTNRMTLRLFFPTYTFQITTARYHSNKIQHPLKLASVTRVDKYLLFARARLLTEVESNLIVVFKNQYSAAYVLLSTWDYVQLKIPYSSYGLNIVKRCMIKFQTLNF